MSIFVMSMMFKVPFGSANRKMVAVRLADFADDDGRGIWPSVATVAEQCELSERTVQRTLAEFVEEGILIVVDEGGGRKTTRYDFNLDRVRTLKKGGEKAPENEGCHGVTGDNGDMRGDTVSPLGCHGVTRTINEPSEEPSLERESAGANGDGGEKSEPVLEGEALHGSGKAAFKAAHRDWPTFTSDSSQASEAAWFALEPAERVRAAADAARYVAASRAEGRKLVCSFAVYLREKRWEKLPEPQAAAPEVLTAPPFGPAWCAERIARLRAYQPPMPMWTTFERAAIAGGSLDEWSAALDKAKAARARMLAFIDSRAGQGQGATVAQASARAGEGYVAVSNGSALWERWKARFDELGWPWLPDMGRHPTAYFPGEGPDGFMVSSEGRAA